MIDLSPQHQDPQHQGKAPGAGTAHPTPQHDAVHHDGVETNAGGRWQLSHEKAEGAVQFLSRWAGPFILLMVVALLGWWIIY